MPTAYTTIAAASAPRIRINKPAPKKAAPLTATQAKEKREKRETKQADIDAAVDEWRSYTNEKAAELAERFDMKPRYFLDIFFQGGAKMVHHQDKINPYNAFKSEKATENRECESIHVHFRSIANSTLVGIAKRVPELHADHYEEYQSLTVAEKEAMVERFRDLKKRNLNLRRDTARAKIQDVSNIVRNMKMLVRSFFFTATLHY
jgi:hypothetical protein